MAKAKAKKEVVEQTKIEEVTAQVKTAARNAYLANLGVYGKAIEQGQEAIDDLTSKREEIKSKGTELFEELVKRGEKVQSDIEAKVEEAQAKIDEVVAERKADLEERLTPVKEAVEKVKARFSSTEEEAATTTPASA